MHSYVNDCTACPLTMEPRHVLTFHPGFNHGTETRLTIHPGFRHRIASMQHVRSSCHTLHRRLMLAAAVRMNGRPEWIGRGQS